MKIKKLLALCIALAMAILCCACTTDPDTGTAPSAEPELTASQIAEKMQNALNANPCSKLETVINMTMSIDAGEAGKIDMSVNNKTDVTYSQDPVSSHGIATVDMEIAGQTSQSTSESYAVIEDGQIVSYVKSNGIWIKVPTGKSPEDYAKTASSLALDTTNLTVDKSTTQWNGREVITLRFAITGDVLQDTVNGILSGMGDMGGTVESTADVVSAADYAKLKCSAVLYLDADTYLPLCEEQSFEGMTEVMAPVYEQLGAAVEVTNCSVSVTFASYDAQPEIHLPADAAEKAEIWNRLLAGEPDNGDGTFTIREGTVLIDLVHPDGFEIAEKDYDHVTFEREDHRKITYMMSYITGEQTLGSGEYFLTKNNSSEKRWTTLGGGKVNRQQIVVDTDTLSFDCDLLGAQWETGREDAYFYAWTPVANDGTGTYYLYIEVTDGFNDGFGNSKNADITLDEFVTYLNAASLSKVTTE